MPASPLFDKTATIKRPGNDGSGAVTYTTVGSSIPCAVTNVSAAYAAPGSTSAVQSGATIRVLDVGAATITGGILLGDYVVIGSTNYEAREITKWSNSAIGGDTLYRVQGAAVYF